MPDPRAGYQIYHNTLEMSSHSPQGRLSIDFTLSDTKCSKSGKESFFITINLKNDTNLPLAVAQGEVIRVKESAHSRGPEVLISNAETRKTISTYRLEVCSVPDIDRMVKGSLIYEPDDFDHLLPGNTDQIVIDINETGLFKDEWCDDFMKKADVGGKYKIDFFSSTWEERKAAPVRCQVSKKGSNVFEVIE